MMHGPINIKIIIQLCLFELKASVFIRPIHQVKFCNSHSTYCTRDISFNFYIDIISPDDGRNCRPKHVACIRNKWMLQYLCLPIGLLTIGHIKPESLYIFCTNTHTHTHTHIHTYIYVCVCVCLCVCTEYVQTFWFNVANDHQTNSK